MNIIKRVRKWRTDKILAWVKPGKRKYTIVVYRRINPRYEFEGGDFDGVNEFRFIAMDYARTRLGALIVQMFFGRDSWSDGLRQQKVVIFPPDYDREIFGDGLTPATYPFEFDGYPEYNATYGIETTAETEGDLYESITGHRSKVLDAYLNTKTDVDERDLGKLVMLDKYEQAEQIAEQMGIDMQRTSLKPEFCEVGKDFRRALDGPRKPIPKLLEDRDSDGRLPGCLDDTPDNDDDPAPNCEACNDEGTLDGENPCTFCPSKVLDERDDRSDTLKFTDTKLFSDYENE